MREQRAEVDRTQRPWLAQIIPLCIFRATGAQCRQGGEAVDVFADDLEFERLRKLRDRAHHLAVEVAAGHALDETAFDLDEIDGQVTQMRERREARTEIVEREAAAELLQC